MFMRVGLLRQKKENQSCAAIAAAAGSRANGVKMKIIKSTCSANLFIPIEELTVLQGNLAEMSEKAHKKLREMFIRYGIRFASHVWKNKGKNYIIDGTGRFKTLLNMKEEGFEIEPIPCVIVEAKDMKEARRLILHGRDRFHETTDQGLYEFLAEAQLDFAEVKTEIEMPEIDLGKFGAEFFNEHATESAAQKTLKEVFEVAIECSNEKEQKKIFTECEKRGWKCRILTL